MKTYGGAISYFPSFFASKKKSECNGGFWKPQLCRKKQWSLVFEPYQVHKFYLQEGRKYFQIIKISTFEKVDQIRIIIEFHLKI